MTKFARICFAVTACIVLFLFVESVYDGSGIWRIVLYAIWFLSNVGVLITDSIQRRKEKKG